MKKVIIASILLNLFQASLLFSNYVHTKTSEKVMIERACMYQFPGPMPEVILDPLTEVPFY